jgi:hypothetical protein
MVTPPRITIPHGPHVVWTPRTMIVPADSHVGTPRFTLLAIPSRNGSLSSRAPPLISATYNEGHRAR